MNPQNFKKIKHWNITGHAHELTFSCFHGRDYLSDTRACEILQEEIEKSRSVYHFKLWAYVIMPNHVHMLILPLKKEYDIAKILSGIKGIMSKCLCTSLILILPGFCRSPSLR